MIWYPSISYRLPSLVVDLSYGVNGCLSPGMQRPVFMMTSSNGNIFRATGHLCGEFTSHKGQWRGPWCLRNHRAHCDVTVMFHGDLNLLHNLIVEDRPLCFRVFENKFSITRVIFSYHYNTNYAASSDVLSTQKCAMMRWWQKRWRILYIPDLVPAHTMQGFSCQKISWEYIGGYSQCYFLSNL